MQEVLRGYENEKCNQSITNQDQQLPQYNINFQIYDFIHVDYTW